MFNGTKHRAASLQQLSVLYYKVVFLRRWLSAQVTCTGRSSSKPLKARRYIDLRSWPSNIQDIKRRTSTMRQKELVTWRWFPAPVSDSLYYTCCCCCGGCGGANAFADSPMTPYIISSAFFTMPTADQWPNKISRYTRLQATASTHILCSERIGLYLERTQGALKMLEWKMQEQTAGTETAGVEIVGATKYGKPSEENNLKYQTKYMAVVSFMPILDSICCQTQLTNVSAC